MTPRRSTEAGDGAAGDWVCELRVPARPERLQLIRRVVEESAGALSCTSEAVQDLVSAVDEACQNIIRYAYKGDPDGVIVMRVRREGADIVIRLIDYAEPVDPACVRPRPLDDLRPGGLGTRLIHAAVDVVEFEPPVDGAGNILKLAKRIA